MVTTQFRSIGSGICTYCCTRKPQVFAVRFDAEAETRLCGKDLLSMLRHKLGFANQLLEDPPVAGVAMTS